MEASVPPRVPPVMAFFKAVASRCVTQAYGEAGQGWSATSWWLRRRSPGFGRRRRKHARPRGARPTWRATADDDERYVYAIAL